MENSTVPGASAAGPSGPIRPRSLKLAKVSASQVEAFRNCERLWYLGWPCGIKQPETPAMRKGTALHKCIEDYLNTGELKPSEEFPDVLSMAQAAMPYLPPYEPDVSKRKYFNELAMNLPTYPNGPEWIGYIDNIIEDVGEHEGKPYAKVRDYKTRSDFKYNKSEEELRKDGQLSAYAHYTFTNSDYEVLEVEHLNILTKGATKKVKPIGILVNREWATKLWNQMMDTVRAMDKLQSMGPDVLSVPATGMLTGQCDKYGGCAHKAICGISGGTRFFSGPAPTHFFNSTPTQTNPTGSETMAEPSILDVLKGLANKNGVPTSTSTGTAPAPSPSPVAAPALPEPAVLPPDAPSRTSTPEEIYAANKEQMPGAPDESGDKIWTEEDEAPVAAKPAEEAPKKRGRPKKTEAEAKEETVNDVTPPVAQAPAAPAKTLVTDPGPAPAPLEITCKTKVLLVNALPSKGLPDVQNLSDILRELGDFAAAAYNGSNPDKSPVADWRLIPYTSTGWLSLAVRTNLHLFDKEYLYVDLSLHGAATVIEELSKVVTTIIRAVR